MEITANTSTNWGKLAGAPQLQFININCHNQFGKWFHIHRPRSTIWTCFSHTGLREQHITNLHPVYQKVFNQRLGMSQSIRYFTKVVQSSLFGLFYPKIPFFWGVPGSGTLFQKTKEKLTFLPKMSAEMALTREPKRDCFQISLSENAEAIPQIMLRVKIKVNFQTNFWRCIIIWRYSDLMIGSKRTPNILNSISKCISKRIWQWWYWRWNCPNILNQWCSDITHPMVWIMFRRVTVTQGHVLTIFCNIFPFHFWTAEKWRPECTFKCICDWILKCIKCKNFRQ